MGLFWKGKKTISYSRRSTVHIKFQLSVSASPARRKHSHGEVDSPAHRKRSHGESDGPVGHKHSHGEIEDDVRSDSIHSNNNATSLEQECSNPEYKLFAMSVSYQGRVVQSIVSLTSSLRGQLVKCFMAL